MSMELISALALFAFATSITPGPNNLMLMASGANYGFRRTVPHMLGIGVGFTVMMLLVGAGLIRFFDLWPHSQDVLKVLGLAYMLFLAWKTATAAEPATGRKQGQPMTFLQAAAFQWVNPKAWAMALTAVTAYAPDRSGLAILSVALIFGAINLPSVSTWTLAGRQIARLLTSPARLRAFNWSLAALLLVSMYPVLLT